MERGKQEQGFPSLVDALPAQTERDLFDIQLAEHLNVPAPLVGRLPLHWVGSVMTLWDAKALVEANARRKRGFGDEAESRAEEGSA